MTTPLSIGAILIGSYVLGSLPFGLWVAKRVKGIDIREAGSGNIGATNVGRVCRPLAGAVVFILDVLKGFAPPMTAAALHLDSQWQVLAGLCAFLGHSYSFLLKFKGGKGIATGLGAFLGTSPIVGALAFALWILAVLLTRFVSVASILAATSLPILSLIFYPGDGYRFGFGLAACLLANYKHRANITRLRSKTEPKVKLPWTKA